MVCKVRASGEGCDASDVADACTRPPVIAYHRAGRDLDENGSRKGRAGRVRAGAAGVRGGRRRRARPPSGPGLRGLRGRAALCTVTYRPGHRVPNKVTANKCSTLTFLVLPSMFDILLRQISCSNLGVTANGRNRGYTKLFSSGVVSKVAGDLKVGQAYYNAI